MHIDSNVLKRTFTFIFVLIFLLLVTWITIEPAPFFFDDRSMLPNQSFAFGPLINPFSSIFSLEGITTFPVGASPYGYLYSYFYKLYSIIGNGIVWRYSLINLGILTITLLFLYQWFKKTNNHSFGIAAMIFFTFTIPVWQMAFAHSSAPATTMTLFTAFALYMYYFYYRKSTSLSKQIFFLLLILLFTRISSLMKGEGRLVFPIIFLFLIIESILIFVRERKEKSLSQTITFLPLFENKNIFLLLSLFFVCVPIGALFIDVGNLGSSETERLSNYGDSIKLYIIATYFPGLMSLTPPDGAGFIHTNWIFYYELFTRIFTLLRGFDLFALFVVMFSLIIYFWQKKRGEEKEQMSMSELQMLTRFSCIWFLMILTAVLLLRGLRFLSPQYVYHSWLYVDISYIMFSFTIFLFTLVTLAYHSLVRYKKFFVYIIGFMLVLHMITALQWGGKYLDYISGIDSAAKFLSTTYKHEPTTVIIVHQGTLPIDVQMNPPYPFNFIDYTFNVPENCSFLQGNMLVIPPGDYASKSINTSISAQDNIFFVSNEPIETTCELIHFFIKMHPQSDTIYYKIKNFLNLSEETWIYVINTSETPNSL